jgi:hypothetical protein
MDNGLVRRREEKVEADGEVACQRPESSHRDASGVATRPAIDVCFKAGGHCHTPTRTTSLGGATKHSA